MWINWVEGCISKYKIHDHIAVGILTYNSERDFDNLRYNMTDWCQSPEGYFESYFTESSLGSITRIRTID